MLHLDNEKQVIIKPQRADQVSRRRKSNLIADEKRTRESWGGETGISGSPAEGNNVISPTTHQTLNKILIAPSEQPHRLTIQEQVNMAYYAMNDGRTNALGPKICVPSNWNFKLLQDLVTSRFNREVVMYLRYGWPLNRNNAPVAQTWWNHRTAMDHPEQINKYVRKELSENTLLGPFVTSPFPLYKTGISPLSTRPKKNDNIKRRVIVDLSWPPWGHSVNSAIPKDTFMGAPVKLTYPTIDRLCKQAKNMGPIIIGWKKDMSRAFLQVPLQPNCWSMLGIFWASGIYFNKSAVMGCRSAPYMCQCTTSMIRHIMANIEYIVFNYIDDFMSIDKIKQAWKSYITLGNLLRDLGVQEALEKSVQPTTVIEFLGIIFDLIRMLLFVPSDKLHHIKVELRKWQSKKLATKQQIQSLAGKLQFISLCVRPGRVFISRLYDWISVMTEGPCEIPDFVRKDIMWWDKYVDTYNGVSMMYMESLLVNQHSFATDASLQAMGAFFNGKYIRKRFPKGVVEKIGHNIAFLEMVALYVALKAWIQELQSCKIHVECDNMAVVQVLHGSRARNDVLQLYLREITYVLATNNCEMSISYIESKMNKKPDMLSRYYSDRKLAEEFQQLISANPQWERTMIADEMFNPQLHW